MSVAVPRGVSHGREPGRALRDKMSRLLDNQPATTEFATPNAHIERLDTLPAHQEPPIMPRGHSVTGPGTANLHPGVALSNDRVKSSGTGTGGGAVLFRGRAQSSGSSPSIGTGEASAARSRGVGANPAGTARTDGCQSRRVIVRPRTRAPITMRMIGHRLSAPATSVLVSCTNPISVRMPPGMSGHQWFCGSR